VQVALLELRSETPHNERFRQQYAVVDDALKSDIADVLRRGIESGAFATDVNPDPKRGPRLASDRRSDPPALNNERFPVAETRAALDGYLDRLLADSEA